MVELLAALRVAEREGIGVDRMVREMVRSGNPSPDIAEVAGPRVRTALVGDVVDAGWMRWLARLRPPDLQVDLNALLLLRRLVDHWWIDVRSVAPVLQRSEPEVLSAIAALERARLGSSPVLESVVGVPAGAREAWRLGAGPRRALAEADAEVGFRRGPTTRPQVALGWARSRGRISSTELASIVGAQATNVGAVLKALERDRLLAPGRPGRRGPGFFYVPIPPSPVN